MDASNIIWLIVIVGALILSSVGKAKKRAQQGAEKGSAPSAPHGEAWPNTLKELKEQAAGKPATATPTMQPAAEHPETLRPAIPAQAALPARTENRGGLTADSLETLPEESLYDIPDIVDLSPALSLETDAGFEQAQRQSLGHAPVQSADKRHSAEKQPTERNTSDIIRDFDLRKAVIYAEILKPKFQEQ